MPKVFSAYDNAGGSITVHLLGPHEIVGDKKFYIETSGDPALSAGQIAALAQAVAAADRQ